MGARDGVAVYTSMVWGTAAPLVGCLPAARQKPCRVARNTKSFPLQRATLGRRSATSTTESTHAQYMPAHQYRSTTLQEPQTATLQAIFCRCLLRPSAPALRCLGMISGPEGLLRRLKFSCVCAAQVPVATAVGNVLPELYLLPLWHRLRCDVCGVLV